MLPITIYKLDHRGEERWRYEGRLLAAGATWCQVEAIYNGHESDDGYVVWRQGDRFIEWFYTDRWYNVFEIHDVTHGHIKGWYCNITFPATITPTAVTWRDLALDVWVSAAGDVRLIDEDEFEALPLEEGVRAAARGAVRTIQERVAAGDPPFDVLIG
ncbi:MAG TPA: DUF402 domain-containing protein [Aggregatilineales bacterium]|nr:DUF402 domain-containing protein [Anaerolineales bacterium]HRE49503.1 DUF402 domain-containing protein [Aggregatilineales bacterium]